MYCTVVFSVEQRTNTKHERCKQPTRCNNFHLLIFLLIYLNLLYMFRATNSPIFRNTLVQRTDIAAER